MAKFVSGKTLLRLRLPVARTYSRVSPRRDASLLLDLVRRSGLIQIEMDGARGFTAKPDRSLVGLEQLFRKTLRQNGRNRAIWLALSFSAQFQRLGDPEAKLAGSAVSLLPIIAGLDPDVRPDISLLRRRASRIASLAERRSAILAPVVSG
jgi:hypothetical protein